MRRRRVLSIAGAGVATGIAGCIGDGPTSDGDGDDTDEGDGLEDADGNGDDDPDNRTEEPSDDDETDGDDGADGADDEESGDGGEESDDGDDAETESDEDAAGDDEDESDANETDDGDESGNDEPDGDEDRHSLTVTVVDSTTEVPLEGIVEVDGDARETGSDGTVIYELESDSYEVTAGSEVYQDSIVTVDLEGDVLISIGLVPTEADLEILDSTLSRETVTDDEEGYVVRGTVANDGGADSEEVIVEVVLYDAEGTQIHERYSSPFEVGAESEREFEFVALYDYNSAFDDVDPDQYDVTVFSYVGHRRLTGIERRESRLSLGPLRF